jgi:DDE superfamily endonuclease
LLTAGPCPSLPHLSLAPGHRRGWGSVYAALRRGHIHVEALRALVLRQPLPAGPPVYAVDVSVWPRADAATSPERGYQYHSPRRRRAGGDPVVPGWAYQWLVRLSPTRDSWDADSWTAPIDVRRVRPEEKPTALAVEQLKALVAAPPAARRGEVALVLFDAGYDASGFTDALAGTPVALLIWLRSNRHFWFAPARPTRPRTGRPRRHGARFVCDDPATWPAPTAELCVAYEAYGRVQVRAWAGAPHLMCVR